MAHRASIAVLLAAVAVSLGGCAALGGGASVVSLMATKKTVMDHVVSFAMDEDCSTIALERGEPYCTDPNAPEPPTPVYYCYRSLADITCYKTEDPYDNGHVAVR